MVDEVLDSEELNEDIVEEVVEEKVDDNKEVTEIPEWKKKQNETKKRNQEKFKETQKNNPYTKSSLDKLSNPYAFSKEQKTKKESDAKLRDGDPRLVDSKTVNNYNITELFKDDVLLKEVLGSDYNNWNRLLRIKDGGKAESDDGYKKLLKEAKKIAWDQTSQLENYYNVTQTEFESLFLDKVKNLSYKQGADNIAKAVERVSAEVGTDDYKLKKRQFVAQFANVNEMTVEQADYGIGMTTELRELGLEISNLQAGEKEVPADMQKRFDLLTTEHQLFISSKFGDNTTINLGWDGHPILGSDLKKEKTVAIDDSDFKTTEALFSSMIQNGLKLTEGELIKESLETNLNNQILWDKDDKVNYDVTINDVNATAFLKSINIEPTGGNANGSEFTLSMSVLARYYDQIVGSSGDGYFGKRSPDGYFALTSNAKNSRFTGFQFDEAEFTGGTTGNDPNKSFKRKIKDHEDLRYSLLKEQAILGKMDLFNVDPSSSNTYALNKKGTGDYLRTMSRIVWNDIYGKKGQLNADLKYITNSPNREVDQMIEQYFDTNGFTLTQTMKDNLKTGGLYELTERATAFLPVIGKFALVDLMISKTGLITGPLKLINAARNFEKAGVGVAQTERVIERLLKANPTLMRGSDDFAKLMARNGFAMAKRSSFSTAMEIGLKVIVEEGKMRTVFGKENYHMGGGAAFLGVGKMFGKIFPNTLANSNSMMTFLGLGRSGTAGMLSTQMAFNLESFIDDVRGNETYLTHVRENYKDLGETGWNAMMDFFVFSSFGVRGVVGKNMMGLRSTQNIRGLNVTARKLAIEYHEKLQKDPKNKELQKQTEKYQKLYSATKTRLDIFSKNNSEGVIKAQEHNVEVINKDIKNIEEKVGLVIDKEKPSSFDLVKGKPIITVNPEGGYKDLTHEMGHYALWKAGGDVVVQHDLYNTIKSSFPGLEASIVEAYGVPNKNGVKEMNRDLKVEEFLMHTVSRLTEPGSYNYYVAKGTYGKVAQSFNRFYTKKYGKRHAMFKELDLTTEYGVLEFLGNFAMVTKGGNITTKYIDFMVKELKNPKYLKKVNEKNNLEKQAEIIKDKKVGEEITNNEKFSLEIKDQIESEIMKIFKQRVENYGDPNNKDFIEDVLVREQSQLKSINEYLLTPTMRNGVRKPAPAEAIAYWIARRAAAKFGNMRKPDIDAFASIVMKGSKKEGNKDRTITGIVENYIKYNSKDGGPKQDISTTLFSQLILRTPEIYEQMNPGWRENKANILDVEFDPNKTVETTEIKDFDVIDKSRTLYEGTIKLGTIFDVTATSAVDFVKKGTYKDLSSANRINESVGPEILKQLRDKGYMSETSQRTLRTKIEQEVLAENKLSKKPFDITDKGSGLKKFETEVNRRFKTELKELKYNYIFSKADMIYKALPKNIDLVTGESNFVMKTFGKFYTNTGKRLTTTDIGYDTSVSKKGEGPYGQTKKVINDPMSMKRAIMDVIFKPAPGGKPLTNSQIDTRIDQALKYVAYTVSNQSVREALNSVDVRRVLEESNAPLINGIIIKQQLSNIFKNSKNTLGDKTLYAKELNETIDNLSKITTKNKDEFVKQFEQQFYELGGEKYGIDLMNTFVKANFSVKEFTQEVWNIQNSKDQFTTMDQITPVRSGIVQEIISGKNFADGMSKIKGVEKELLWANMYGSSFRSVVRKDGFAQEMVYDGHATISSYLPEVIVNTLMHNKFMGSGSISWETGVFQEKGVNSANEPAWRTMSADALKSFKIQHEIKGSEKPTAEMLKEIGMLSKTSTQEEINKEVDRVESALNNYKIVDNGKAKEKNIELLEQALAEGKDLNDPTTRLEIRKKWKNHFKVSEKTVQANEVILELYANSLKKYYDSSVNKAVALNNISFILGSQTNIGNGPIRGLATHRSISMDLVEMRKGSRSEHGLQAQNFSLNVTNLMVNSKSFKTDLKELIEVYKQDIISKKVQQAADYVVVDGKRISTNTTLDGAKILQTNSEYTWLARKIDANNQVQLYGSFTTLGQKIATNKTIGNLVSTLKEGAGISKKYSKNIGKEDLLHKLIKIENARKGIFTIKKGGTFLDFDDTLVFTKSLIKYTKPDGTRGSLNAEQYAKNYESLTELGYKWDFSEFNEVKNPSLAPLFNKAIKLQKKFGPEHMYIVTARPSQSAPAIHGYLKSKGLNIPFKNITGLGNSTSEAKGLWVAEKIGEGYNDIYFADDALQNVQAVKNVVDQFDVKSKVQLARKKMSLELSDEFNLIIEQTSGVKKQSVFSKGRAKIEGKGKGRFDFFMSPSAEDFGGLLYKFAGKGKLGDSHLNFLQEKLITPFIKGTRDMDAARQSTTNDYSSLKKQHPKVVKLLKKKVPGSIYTHDAAIRVHRWTKAGHEVPEISKAEHKLLFEYVANNPELLEFSEKLGMVTKLAEGYTAPGADWLADTIVSDLSNMTEGVNRASMLHEWVNNRQAIFGDWGFEKGKAILTGDNMNKIQAVHGTDFREALEDITYRMEFGKNMTGDAGRIVNNWNKWVNGSVGSIMFLNGRSAALQTLSTVNYMNWHDNNPLKAAGALANFPQFIKDFTYIFNSDMLKQRRSGLKLDINEAELAGAVNGKSNKVKASIAYLLKKGFMPTQIADSFAISSGGATFYRNRIKSLKKSGVLKEGELSFEMKDIQEKAWLDFAEVTEKTQQSSSPYLISQQQATPLGKTILSFNNTPMQYNRIMKKAFLDIANKRGDLKTHISKIVYYGGVQNVIFHTLQSALFALTLDDEGDLYGKEEEKSMRVLNGMVDTVLRGTGLTGAVLSTVKNTLLEYYKQDNKDWKADHTYTVLQSLKLSPSIGSKAGGIYSATQGMKFNAGATEFMSPWAYNNPSLLAKAQVFESVTNIPVARIVKKTNNLSQAFNSENQKWQRIMLGGGWSSWDLGVRDSEVDGFNEMFRKYKANSKKTKRKSKAL